MKTPENSALQIRRITLVGLVINVSLSAAKFAAGWFGKSQAVIADSIHSLTDVLTDVAILVGAKHWTAPPDEDHPYGHGRIETLITLLIGASLAGVAVKITFDSLATVRESHSTPGAIALYGALLSIACKEILFQWTMRRGREISSKAVVANAWHHRSDAFSSIPVAAAVAVTIVFPQWAFVDHIGAIVVSVFIIRAAFSISSESLRELVDSGVSDEITNAVKQISSEHTEVREVHKIRARRVGPGLYVDLHMLVDPDMTVFRGHEISEQVHDRLLESDLPIVDVVVHLEPYPES